MANKKTKHSMKACPKSPHNECETDVCECMSVRPIVMYGKGVVYKVMSAYDTSTNINHQVWHDAPKLIVA